MTSTESVLAENSSAQAPPLNLASSERSLSAALSGANNSLGVLRLVLASLVIFTHGFPLGGFGEDPLWNISRGQASLGTIAVGGFFAISGYLVAKSGQSTDFMQFAWRRSLRIFPAFWGVLFFAAFVVGPIIWLFDGHNLSSYFTLSVGGPFTYVTSNFFLNIGTYGIHDIFATTTPYGGLTDSSVFNGALWTLSYEWLCYLVIGTLVVSGAIVRAKILIPIIAGGLVVVRVAFMVDETRVGQILPAFADPQLIWLLMVFMFGATLAVYSRSVPYSNGLGILSGVLFVVTLRYGGFEIIGLAAGAYFVLYLGAALPVWFQKIGRSSDYSYGMYIYGFVVQQVTAYFGLHKLGYVPYVVGCIVITFAFAWASWHLIEKRAMKLKNLGPGRGLTYWRETIAEARQMKTLRMTQ